MFILFREVFGYCCKVILCLVHILKAWLEGMARKMVNKKRCREAFNALKTIVFLRPDHDASDEERSKAVQDAIEDFKKKFGDEKHMLEYFESFWESKHGVKLRMKVQQCISCMLTCMLSSQHKTVPV